MTTAGAQPVVRGRTRRHVRGYKELLRLVLLCAALMACLFVYIGRMAAASAAAKEIDALNQAIAEEQRISQQLTLQLAARMDPARVRDEAVGRLGMSYPGVEQICILSAAGETWVP